MPGKCEHLKKYQFSSTNQPKNKSSRKGKKNWKTVFKRYLNQEFEIKKKDGSTIVLPAMDAIAIKAIANAVATGDCRAIEMIMNRTDGLPKQALEQILKKPLQIAYNDTALVNDKKELEEQDNFETNIKNDDNDVIDEELQEKIRQKNKEQNDYLAETVEEEIQQKNKDRIPHERRVHNTRAIKTVN